MITRTELAAALALLPLVVGSVPGCGSGTFAAVRDDVEARIGRDVVARDPRTDDRLQRRARTLLAGPLDADAAVEIALWQSPELQAELEELDVAQADLLRAALPANPELEVEIRFPPNGNEEAVIEGSFLVDVSDAIRLPLRRAVQDAELASARARAARAALGLAYDVRLAFRRLQSNLQLAELFQQVVETLRASWEAAVDLREAGNVPRLDVVQQRALYEEARVALAQAELAVLQSRERLNVLMGLTGEATTWEVAGERLPDPPALEPELDAIEASAIDRSLELEARRQRLEAFARRVGLARTRGLIPRVHVGVSVEREEGEWWVGPAIEAELPIFNQGQGQIDRSSAELRVEQHRYLAEAVRIRSIARRARNAYLNARERVRFYRETLLPVRERVLEETLLQYNAMTLGILELLTARRNVIDTARAYVEALRDFWVAHATLEQIAAGGAADEDMAEVRIPSLSRAGGDGGH